MKIVIPPPLTEPLPAHSFMQDFKLLLRNQLLVTYNKMRHWPLGAWLGAIAVTIGLGSIFIYLGVVAHGALKTMPPEMGSGFLTLIFMGGVAGLLFFGVTSAFVTLYMSEDMELLFLSPVPLRVVFAVKSLVVVGSNFLAAALFCFMPGIFYGLLFQAGILYYGFVLLVGFGLWILGTALAILLNLAVMRIVPPHRSKEAVGFIGALAGLLIALTFQLPNIIMHTGQQFDLTEWLSGQGEMLRIMGYFPWGWGAKALGRSILGDYAGGFSWVLLLLLGSIIVFAVAFLLLERGFRRGWISINQGESGRKRRKYKAPAAHKTSGESVKASHRLEDVRIPAEKSSALRGMWLVAKKDLLYMRRDTREWFGYMMPLVLMAFFVGQYLFTRAAPMQASMVSVLVMYSVMFSGNMALQSFGREGESDWLLNSVPLAGWPVAWGKLLGSVIPALVLMQILLVGTALALKVSASMLIMLTVGTVLLTLGASSIGLFYSINNCRYNPDSPQHRISPGASYLMYLINIAFMLFLAFGMVLLMPPPELIAVLPELKSVTMNSAFFNNIVRLVIFITRPLNWPSFWRTLTGLIVVFGTWSSVFFGFMAATVRQSRKGFRVELVTGSKKKLKK